MVCNMWQNSFLSFCNGGKMSRFGKRIKSISLKYKIGILTFVVAVVPLIIFGAAITLMYGRAIVRRSNRHIEQNIQIMSDRIDAVFGDGELCTNYLTLNLNTIENDNSKHKITKDNLINSQLNQSILIFDGIDSIVFIAADGQFYSTNVKLQDKKDKIEQSAYLEQIKDNNGRTKLFNVEDSSMMVNDEPVVTMGKRVINIVTGNTIGYLFVNMDISHIEESVSNEISYYLLFDGTGTCVTGIQDEKLVDNLQVREEIYSEDSTKSVTYQGDEYLIARDVLDDYGWTILGVTNLNEFNVSHEELFSILFVIGIVVATLIIFATVITSWLISKPLVKLKNGAETIANGNLDVQFSFTTYDEIGRLGNIFNYMTQKIKELIRKVDDEAKKKREYELALVQEQVKPHFLYNTLDIIIMLIEMNKSREASRVTKKLADYYKNSLSGSEEIVSIEREIQIARDYLDLQMMRYGDSFTYDIETDEDTLCASIPKMTLQPIIENAIYHGLKYKENWGNIHIRIRRITADVEIVVEDNGIGMTEDKLAQMQSLRDTPNGHFGVYSVNHRLKLYYGEPYGMDVNSTYGNGTRVRILIPFLERENADD